MKHIATISQSQAPGKAASLLVKEHQIGIIAALIGIVGEVFAPLNPPANS